MNFETLENQNHQEAEKAVGRLITRCAGLEFLVNYLVEAIYTSNSQIDKAQESPLIERWLDIKQIILVTHINKPVHQDIQKVDEAVEYYKINLKRLRDICAHSPLVMNYSDPARKVKIIQSRRYRERGFNDLQITDVTSALQGFITPMQNATGAIGSLQKILNLKHSVRKIT